MGIINEAKAWFSTKTDQRLKVQVYDFFLNVALGNVPNHELVEVFGEILSFGSPTSPADVSSFTSPSLYPFPTGLSVLSIVSDDAADTLAGTGGRTLLLEGLDDNYDFVTDTIDLDGTTPVLTAVQFFRLNKVEVITVGSGGENVGNITISHSGTEIANILPRAGNILQAIYTIENGKIGIIGKWGYSTHAAEGSPSTNKEVIISLKTRKENQAWQVRRIGGQRSDGGGEAIDTKFFVVPAKSDIRVEVTALVNNSAIASGFDLVLVS